MSQDPKPAQPAGSAPGTPEENPETLMAEYAKGLKAYNQLYARYEKPFYSKAAYLLKNHPSSEEATKSALTQLWVTIAKRPTSFESQGKGSFERWAHTVLAHLCVDLLRKHQPEVVSIEEDPEELDRASHSQVGLLAEDRRDPFLKKRLAQALDTLPETQRVVLCLKLSYHFTHEEIASVLGIPVGTVKSRLNTACKRVHERMQELLRDNPKP